MLAKLLDGVPWRPMRVALLLRANSGLYETLGAGPVQFRFFDTTQSFHRAAAALAGFDPTILVAPAHVLGALAREREAGRLTISPRRVISVAEVLDPLDRRRIEAVFGVRVEQIYQATEGFLGATCPQGVIHLNEEYLIVEREWVDAARTRFVPVITDLYRSSQPVIRYRLNDVLVPRSEPCLCGRPTLALERIEGREDDVLWLSPVSGTNPVPVFADVISRVFVRSLPGLEDYSLEETDAGCWRAGVAPQPDSQTAARLLAAIQAAVAALGAKAPQVVVVEAQRTNAAKLRRIRGKRSSCPR
jgi:putative adenylate-forming enzyme